MVVVSREDGAPTLQSQNTAQQNALEQGVRADPLVQAVLARFPGAEIVGVRRREDAAVPELPADDVPPANPDDYGANDTDDDVEGDTMTDFLGLMKQATQLKAKMQEMQAELDQITVEGISGGGMVTVTLTAKGEMKGLKIDDSLVKPAEKEIIEDLIVAAHADARRKAEALLAGEDEEPHRRPAAAAGDEACFSGNVVPAKRAKRARAGTHKAIATQDNVVVMDSGSRAKACRRRA